MSLLVFLLLPLVSYCWPDGAPCVHSAYESMNPLEAIEHQGGLQMTTPPYEIKVDQKCYWRNQPISLTLQGLNETVWFKGFVIQPVKWNNDQLGDRIGQLMRLDDNGSWQQQCFRFKNAATHSHDEKKKHIRMWWKIDDEVDTVQFIATVVKHQTMFWVRSVVSNPIPPCRLNRFGIRDYVPPAPQMPPMTKQFKTETHNMFGGDKASAFSPKVEEMTTPSFFVRTRPTTTEAPVTTTLAPTTVESVQFRSRELPQSSSAKMSQIIPLQNMEIVHSHGFTAPPATPTAQQFVQQPQTTPVFVAQFPSTTRFVSRPPVTRVFNRFGTLAPQPISVTQRPFFQQQRRIKQLTVQPCVDRDNQQRCLGWRPYCRTPRHMAYMSNYCRRTCAFC